MNKTRKQHYVPQFFLRFFADEQLHDKNKYTVSMYLLSENEIIKHVPIKSVCFEDYLYGEENTIENIFSKNESDWSRVLTIYNSGNRHIVKQDNRLLINHFLAYQYLRTLKRVRHTDTITKSWLFSDDVNALTNDIEDLRKLQSSYNKLDATYLTLAQVEPFRREIQDLSCIIIDNVTEVDFIISDNPVIFTNIFTSNYFGVNSIGDILWIPISPKKLLVLYDRKAINFNITNYQIADIELIKYINSYQYIVMDRCLFNITKELPYYIHVEMAEQYRSIYHKKTFLEKVKFSESGEQPKCQYVMKADFIPYFIELNFLRLTPILEKIPKEMRFNISRVINQNQLKQNQILFNNDNNVFEEYKNAIQAYWANRI